MNKDIINVAVMVDGNEGTKRANEPVLPPQKKPASSVVVGTDILPFRPTTTETQRNTIRLAGCCVDD